MWLTLAAAGVFTFTGAITSAPSTTQSVATIPHTTTDPLLHYFITYAPNARMVTVEYQ